jgi:Cu-Zn family superoxide dismutase
MPRLFAVALLCCAAPALAGSPSGRADIEGVRPGSEIRGSATLTPVEGGLKVALRLTGVPDGPHAVHIHEFGDCGDLARKAGGHYNPQGRPHGSVRTGPARAHPGDMGNAVARAGVLALVEVLPDASLAGGRNPVAGRAIVVHERADRFSQPAGDAGGRIACGVIMMSD